MGDTGIGIVICTFAFDSQRGREYSDRSVDMGKERMGKKVVQFVLTAFAGVDTAVGDCAAVQEVEAQFAVVANHLNCLRVTLSLRSNSHAVRQVLVPHPAYCANKVRTSILQLGTKPPGTHLHLLLPFQP